MTSTGRGEVEKTKLRFKMWMLKRGMGRRKLTSVDVHTRKNITYIFYDLFRWFELLKTLNETIAPAAPKWKLFES